MVLRKLLHITFEVQKGICCAYGIVKEVRMKGDWSRESLVFYTKKGAMILERLGVC